VLCVHQTVSWRWTTSASAPSWLGSGVTVVRSMVIILLTTTSRLRIQCPTTPLDRRTGIASSSHSLQSHVQYPPRGEFIEDVNVISPNQGETSTTAQRWLSPGICRRVSTTIITVPPTSPVSRQGLTDQRLHACATTPGRGGDFDFQGSA
jgi:hypothetical protein